MFDKKKWYLKNQTRILSEKKAEYQLNKQKHLDNGHDYYKKNKEKILEQKRLKDIEFKRKLCELVGDKCVICGSTKRLCYHEIHGKPHPSRKYVLDHYKDFVALCSGCHVGLHRFLRRGKINIELLVQLLRNILS
jgi:hypothetical protein